MTSAFTTWLKRAFYFALAYTFIPLSLRALPQTVSVLTSPLAVTTCSGNGFFYGANTSVYPTTLLWSRAAVPGITESASTGSNNIFEVLHNTTGGPLDVIYVYTLINGTDTNRQNVTVTVNLIPAKPAISASGPTSFCPGGAVTLTSTSAAGYLWSNGATTRSINVSATGIFQVQTIENACTSSVSDGVQVTVKNASVPLSISGSTTICAGGINLLSPSTEDADFCSLDHLSTGQKNGVTAFYSLCNNMLDGSGNGLHGSTTSLPSLEINRRGQANEAYAFDGSNNYVSLPGSSVTGDFSLSFWVKTNSYGAYNGFFWWSGHGLLDAEVGGNDADFGTALIAGKVVFGLGGGLTGGGQDASVTSAVNVNDNTWHHIAATRTKLTGKLLLYIDGTLSASGTADYRGDVAVSKIALGRIATGGSYFTGSIDDVLIYNRVLDSTEVSELVVTQQPYTYTWSNGSHANSLLITSPGTYSLNASGLNSCSSSPGVSLNVSASTAPAITDSLLVNGVCSGLPYIYTPNFNLSGTACTWKRAAVAGISNAKASGTGSVADTLINTTAGTVNVVYQYTLTASNGCTSTQSITVPVFAHPVTPTISTSFSALCPGTSATLTASSAGAYLWSTGQTTQSITVYLTGNYSVQIFANGCISTVSAETPILTTAVIISGNTSFCSGSSSTIKPSTANNLSSVSHLTGSVASGIAAYYPFSGNVSDVSGNAQNGSGLSAPSYVSDRRSNTSHAASYNGSTNYTNIPCSISGDFTISFWLKTNSNGGYGSDWWSGSSLVDAEVSGNSADFGTSLLNGHLAFGMGGGGSFSDVTVTSPGSVNDDAWHHVVATRVKTSGAMALYVDGSPAGTATAGYRGNVSEPFIGIGRETGGTNYYTGYIDDVILYNRALTATEAALVYNEEQTYSYSWNTGAVTDSLTVTTSGTYSVLATGMQGCTNGGSVFITVNDLPDEPTFSHINGSADCIGHTINVTNTAGCNVCTYLWNTGSTASTAVITSGTNNYNVTVTSSAGCSVPGSNISVTSLNTGTWLGTGSEWTTPANWCGGVPGTGTNVNIQAQYASGAWPVNNYPVISGAGQCHNLTLGTGTTLELDAGADLAVSGAVSSAGIISGLEASTVNFTGDSIQVVPKGKYYNITFSGSGQRNLTADTVRIAGALSPGSNAVTVAGNTIEFNGAAQTIPAFSFNNLAVAGSGSKSLSGNVTVSKKLILKAGTMSLNGYMLSIDTLTAPILRSVGTLDASATGSVLSIGNISSTGGNALTLPDGLFSGSSVYGLSNYRAAGLSLGNQDLTVSGNLLLSAANLNLNGNSLTLNGTVSGSGKLISTSASNLGIGGSAALGTLTFAPASALNNLSFDRAFNGSAYLGSDVAVSGTITMTRGVLYTNGNILTLGSAASFSSENDSSFISGKVQTTRTAAQNVLNNFGGIGVEITAAGAEPGSTYILRNIGETVIGYNLNQGIKRKYTITPTLDAGLNATLTFRYLGGAQELNGISKNDLTLFKSTDGGSTWTKAGFTTRDANSKSITVSGVNSFSDWAAASQDAPLPVNLLSFSGETDGTICRLHWSTATEQNNRGFMVNRSINGKDFTALAFVAGSGTTISRHNYNYTDSSNGSPAYYRLEQTDYNGMVTRLPAIYLGNPQKREPGKMNADIFPNPVNNEALLNVYSALTEKIHVNIVNLVGELIHENSMELQPGFNSSTIDCSGLSAGVYTIQLVSERGLTVLKIVKL
ncbi:MAG: LamG-like jellyroll fold domain-containing protein [Bacteroidota bacterium]